MKPKLPDAPSGSHRGRGQTDRFNDRLNAHAGLKLPSPFELSQLAVLINGGRELPDEPEILISMAMNLYSLAQKEIRIQQSRLSVSDARAYLSQRASGREDFKSESNFLEAVRKFWIDSFSRPTDPSSSVGKANSAMGGYLAEVRAAEFLADGITVVELEAFAKARESKRTAQKRASRARKKSST